MGYSQYDPPLQTRTAWNAGKTVGTKRPLKQKQIWAIRFFLDREGRLRDRALFDLAIDSKLRGCDPVRLSIGDVVAGSDIRTRAIVVQKKTGRPVQFELTADSSPTAIRSAEADSCRSPCRQMSRKRCYSRNSEGVPKIVLGHNLRRLTYVRALKCKPEPRIDDCW